MSKDSGSRGMVVSGYEIHVGVTESEEGVSGVIETADGDDCHRIRRQNRACLRRLCARFVQEQSEFAASHREIMSRG